MCIICAFRPIGLPVLAMYIFIVINACFLKGQIDKLCISASRHHRGTAYKGSILLQAGLRQLSFIFMYEKTENWKPKYPLVPNLLDH